MLRLLKAAAHLWAGDFDATDDALRQDDRPVLGTALRAVLQARRGDTDSVASDACRPGRAAHSIGANAGCIPREDSSGVLAPNRERVARRTAAMSPTHGAERSAIDVVLDWSCTVPIAPSTGTVNLIAV